jgi:hypothetical protein
MDELMATLFEDIEAIKHTVRGVAGRLAHFYQSPLSPQVIIRRECIILSDVLEALEALRERLIEERKES